MIKTLNRKPSPSDLKNGETCIYFDRDRPVLVYKDRNKLWFSSLFSLEDFELFRNPNVIRFLQMLSRPFRHGMEEDGAGGSDGEQEGAIIECDTLRVRRKTVTAENQYVGLNPIGSSIILTNSANVRLIDEEL